MATTSGRVSAIADQLARYANTARQINGDLNNQANLLRDALGRFAASRTEYNTGVGPQLAEELGAYVRRIAPTDEWMRRVGEAFCKADQGQMGAGAGARAKPATPPEKKKQGFWDKLGAWEDRADDWIHTGLDVAGMNARRRRVRRCGQRRLLRCGR